MRLNLLAYVVSLKYQRACLKLSGPQYLLQNSSNIYVRAIATESPTRNAGINYIPIAVASDLLHATYLKKKKWEIVVSTSLSL